MKKIKKTVRRAVDSPVDGDTFKTKRKVNGSNYIRLIGINTPERGKKNYSQAKNALNKLISNKKVSITPVGKSYKRVVAKVTVNRKNVSKAMSKYSKKRPKK